MAGNKYLALDTAGMKEVISNQSSAGAGDAGKLTALDSTGKLDTSFMPTGIGPDTVVVATSEAVADGDWVNIWSDTGVAKVRKADATTAGKEANGFVLAAFPTGDATVYCSGFNSHLTGLTDGAIYYLSASAGTGSVTPPTGANKIVQVIGRAVSDTTIDFKPSTPITLAS